MDLVAIYYDISYILDDDIEIVTDAIKELTKTNKKRSSILLRLELLRLKGIEKELNQLYDMSRDNLQAFKLKKQKQGLQTTIYDFIKG